MTAPDGLTTPVRLIPPPPATRADRRMTRMAASGGGRVDRLNRTVFVLLGLAMVAAGAAGLLLDQGTLSWTSPATLYVNRAADAAASPDLAAGIAMAVCLVLFALGLRWAFAQLRPVSDGERLGTIRLFTGPRGRTTIAATSVAKAAAADIAARQGVTSAKVRLRALRPRTRVTSTIELGLDAEPDGALGELEEALDRLLAALDTGAADADIEIRIRFARSGRSSRSDRPSRVE